MKKSLFIFLPLLWLAAYIWVLKLGCLAQVPKPSGVCQQVVLWPSVSQDNLWEISFWESDLWMIFTLTVFFFCKKNSKLLLFIDSKESFFSYASIHFFIFWLLCFLIYAFSLLFLFSNTNFIAILNFLGDLSTLLATSALSIGLIRNEKYSLKAGFIGIASTLMYFVGIPFLVYILERLFK